MATVYPLEVYRVSKTAIKPNPGTEVKQIIPMPNRFANVTLWAQGSAAACCKVELTYSDGAAIAADTAVWLSVHTSLDAVGTAPVPYDFGSRVCTAFRVSSLTDNQTAILTLLAK